MDSLISWQSKGEVVSKAIVAKRYSSEFRLFLFDVEGARHILSFSNHLKKGGALHAMMSNGFVLFLVDCIRYVFVSHSSVYIEVSDNRGFAIFGVLKSSKY